LKYYIIAGEASGDLHAANLIAQLKQKDPHAEIRAWGGDKMQAQGAVVVKHYRDLAFMGFVEVFMNLKTILRNLSFCEKDMLTFNPDALILVDYPGFNLRVAKFAHKKGFRVFYYISPQVWAWKKRRVFQIQKTVDKMIVILPFEKEFYNQYQVDSTFVGHPLLDELSKINFESLAAFRKKNKLSDKKIIALLPGSRKQEIKFMLREMLKITSHYPDFQFIIAGAPSLDLDYYQKIIGKTDVQIIFGQTYDLLHHAEAALVTSGTATLETALLETPEVVCYIGNPISYQIAKHLIHVNYISLVNLIMNREVVKELIQSDLNEKNLNRELSLLLFDENKQQQLKADYQELKIALGNAGASENAAKLIVDSLNEK
jgi:lipid-A-disaccharide synthase